MSGSAKDLEAALREIDGRGYKAYKSIKGSYKFSDFRLLVDHVQGDPFADPSKVRVIVPAEVARLPEKLYQSKSREIALRDFLTRQFDVVARRHSKICGSGKSGVLGIDTPGQQILERTSVFVTEGQVEARFVVGLPANGRRVLGDQAARILCEVVPKLVDRALKIENLDEDLARRTVETAEDADWIRSQLQDRGLVAFVADGSILPRASGIDDRPLQGDAQPFYSPEPMRVAFECPNRGRIEGLGIPRGVTVIVGGGFHGKSTLLNAVEKGVYNHIPDDGREFVITDDRAYKVRSEDGRSVTGVSISPFINNLPYGRDTDFFSTPNASGSTSQAANIVEALEAGAGTLLIDEDTSATNFMIRDRRMQELIAKEKEPITPFTDRVRQLYEHRGVSTVLVMGGSGDYFDSADHVIAMEAYEPREVTSEAKDIAVRYATGRHHEGGSELPAGPDRIPKPKSFDASKGKKDRNIRVRRTDEIEFGTQGVDMTAVEQLVHESQMRSIAAAMAYAGEGDRTRGKSLPEVLDAVMHEVREKGLDQLSGAPAGNLAVFRRMELAAAINRLRSLQLEAPRS